MKEEKLIYFLWPGEDLAREALQKIMLNRCAQSILGTGTSRLELHIADRESDMKSPAPNLTRDEPVKGMVSVWIDPSRRNEIEDILNAHGFSYFGYRVEDTVYRDYGENRHSGPRYWPDGKRSPGVTAVTLMERPERIDYEEWISRWHGTMSPVSEEMQPRMRYVRNVVKEILTEGAYNLSGIVTEQWPSKRHVSNPFLFYGAKNPFQLVKNMYIMFRTVTSILELKRIRTYMMGEYFIKTDFKQ